LGVCLLRFGWQWKKATGLASFPASFPAMSELICGSGKQRDRERGDDADLSSSSSSSAAAAAASGGGRSGLGASGRIWAGRQCDADGQTFCRGFVRPSAGDVIGATKDSGERSFSRRRPPLDWEASGHALRLDAVPGGPQMALGECSRGKQQWLFNHSAVVLPSLSGGDPAWITPLRSTARGVSLDLAPAARKPTLAAWRLARLLLD
jgi:hypothetical protein